MNLSAPGNADKHGMSLAARVAEGPCVAASSTADQRLRDWLAELEPQHGAGIDAQLGHPLARSVQAGIAEVSP